MSTKIKWAVWSGEGEVGSKKIKTATLHGIKRILTQERCGGDRFAHACPAHWPEAQFCSSARECDIDNLTEADIERMHAGQALGSIRTPKKAASSRENGKKGGRPTEKKTYWILSGEGENGTWEKHTATLTGIKRIATKERCGGDRWAQIWEEIPETETTKAHIYDIDNGDMRDIPDED